MDQIFKAILVEYICINISGYFTRSNSSPITMLIGDKDSGMEVTEQYVALDIA